MSMMRRIICDWIRKCRRYLMMTLTFLAETFMAKARNTDPVDVTEDGVVQNGSCKKDVNDRDRPDEKMLIPKGLPNLGNTCFFNAVMQCLMNTQPVACYLEHLKKLEHVSNEHRYSTTVNEKLVDVPIAQIPLPDVSMPMVGAFEDVFRQFRENRVPCPRTLFAQISRKAPRFRGFSQQDAHELLRYLMDGLRQEEVDRFKRAFAKLIDKNCRPCKTKEERDAIMMEYKAYLDGPARPIIDAVFGGLLQQSIKCHNCGFISIRYEPFLDLSLPLQHLREADNYPMYISRKQLKMERQREEGGKPQKMSKHQKKKELKGKKKKNKKSTRGRRASSCTKDDDDEEVAEPNISANNGVETEVDGEPEAAEAAVESSANNSDEEKDAKPQTAATTRCVSRLADEDDIAELAQLTEPTTGGYSVFNSLRRFIMPELLSGPNAYECEKCCARKKGEASTTKRRSVEASKRYLISKPPLILTLHLKRFEQTFIFGKMTTKKFRGVVDFTDTLDLAPFCRRSVKNIGPKQKEILYSLYGIVSHSGDLNGGHYVAYVKARPQMETIMRRLFDRSVRFEPDSLSDVIAEKCKRLSVTQLDDCNNNNGTEENGVDSERKTDQKPKCNGTAKENGISAKVEAERTLQSIAANSKWYYVSDSSIQAVSKTRVFDAEAYILFYERVY